MDFCEKPTVIRRNWFTCLAQGIAYWSGSSVTFGAAFAIVLIWAVTGPMFDYSNTWQLVINTGTTIITFLMVFLIQNTQNRDTKALQLKLDELIRATDGAHTVMLNLEKLDEEELEAIGEKYEMLATQARKRLRSGKTDTNIPKMDFGGSFIK